MKVLARNQILSADFHTLKILTIETGIPANQVNKDIFESIYGQLSDGIWENNSKMNVYWKSSRWVDKGGKIVIEAEDPGCYPFVYHLERDPVRIRGWFAQTLKKIIKFEELDWKRTNTQKSDFMSRGNGHEVTVQDCYKVYDALLNRKERIH